MSAAAMAQPQRLNDRRLGIGLVLFATLSWSFAGLFARLVHVDLWTATAMRAVAAGVFLAIVFVVQYRTRSAHVLLQSTRAAWAPIVLGAASMVLLMAAFFYGHIANVAVIYATAPFWAALMLRVWYSVPIDRKTLIAAGFALIGVAIVVGGSLVTKPGWGDLLALVMTISFIASSVLLTRNKVADSTAVSLTACALCVAATLPLAALATLTPADIVWLTLFGITSSGIAYVCFVAGARLISPTEAGLIGVAEVPLTPLWVLLAFGERPALTTVIGGLIIVSSVIGHLLLAQRGASTSAKVS